MAHDAASQAGVADHIASARMELWTDAYGVLPLMERINTAEAQEIGRLRALSRTGGPLGVAEQSQVLNAVAQLRVQDTQMWNHASWTLRSILRLGPLDERRRQQFLNRARDWYGACVQDPPPKPW